MNYALREKPLLLSDGRAMLLILFGSIALGTGVIVAMQAGQGHDAAIMTRVGLAIAALGLVLLSGAAASHLSARSLWSELLQSGQTVSGRVTRRQIVPGKYGGTLLVFDYQVDGVTYSTSLQGKALDPVLERLQPGDAVPLLVNPKRPKDEGAGLRGAAGRLSRHRGVHVCPGIWRKRNAWC